MAMQAAHRHMDTPPPAGSATPLSNVLRAVASEVAELAVAADSLQGLVGSLLSDPLAMVDARAVEQGQALDAIVQRLQALETFLSALAPELSADWAVDPQGAADMLLLARVAQKLSGNVVENQKEDNGDCDFF